MPHLNGADNVPVMGAVRDIGGVCVHRKRRKLTGQDELPFLLIHAAACHVA